ncbi:hypothetical protein GQ53DRAFT_272016 [Thozetella sp. PMI_491]|nr:hypothetical protein GQ53DRAFT_272016 [Thozetella sp. PMI_491]
MPRRRRSAFAALMIARKPARQQQFFYPPFPSAVLLWGMPGVWLRGPLYSAIQILPQPFLFGGGKGLDSTPTG